MRARRDCSMNGMLWPRGGACAIVLEKLFHQGGIRNRDVKRFACVRDSSGTPELGEDARSTRSIADGPTRRALVGARQEGHALQKKKLRRILVIHRVHRLTTNK